MGRRIKEVLNRIQYWNRKTPTAEMTGNEEAEKNPYLLQMREIMEAVLWEKGISYGEFYPVIIDGEDSEDALKVIRLLGKDLNRLMIFTDYPAYFAHDVDNMYEEYGLAAEIYAKLPKRMAELRLGQIPGNVILDFEHSKEQFFDINFGKKLYIPIFKRTWESRGNLDIAVPIGYNTVIVSISKKEPENSRLDKYERAFWLQDIEEDF